MFNFANNNAVYFDATVMNFHFNGDNLIMQMGSKFNKDKDINILSGEEVRELKDLDRTKLIKALVYARNHISSNSKEPTSNSGLRLNSLLHI